MLAPTSDFDQAAATLSLLDTKSLSGPARLTAFPSTAANSISADPARTCAMCWAFTSITATAGYGR
ncbi:hypothetical protein LNO81_01040 [Klebsiella variicola subsp. variicola]|nr:hypothetical protein [Klebsiella variicola subsp. variicola]